MSRKRKRRSSPPQHRSLLARLRRNPERGRPVRPVRILTVTVLFMVTWAIIRYEPITPPEEADIVVYTSTSCKCYLPWVRELKRAGIAVGVVQTRSVMNTQVELGVPREFAACHTASAAGYWIEGHVPAAAIATLLQSQPQNVGGIAHLRAEQQTGERLQWEVVTYDSEGRLVSSESQVHSVDETDELVPHDP